MQAKQTLATHQQTTAKLLFLQALLQIISQSLHVLNAIKNGQW
jgi:hypothetical protein